MKKVFMKVVSLTLAAALTFVIVQLTVFGNQTSVADSDYLYSVDGNNATITGCNAELSGAVMLPSTLGGFTVTGIGEAAFKDCSTVTCFFLPDTVTSIGKYAFEGCTSLINTYFSDNIVSVGEGAYWDCTSLVSVTLPETVTSVGSCAFYGCTALKSLVVLGRTLNIAGIFNVQLDIGEVIALGAGVFGEQNGEVQTVVYCYDGSAAYNDALRCTMSEYVLLDNCTLTSYSVKYIDSANAELYPARQLLSQPSGIDVAEVAADIPGYTIETQVARKTLSDGAAANEILFTYDLLPETTTLEPTTVEPTTEEPTTEEPTTEEPTTEEPTTEEPTTEEPTTEEPTTEEPTTEEPTTEEPTTEEPPAEEIKLVAATGTSAHIDYETGYITGLNTGVTYSQITDYYLQVLGAGHITCSNVANIGTGTTITLFDESNHELAEFTIIIFGDATGDGIVNQSDMAVLMAHVSGIDSIVRPEVIYAVDLNSDELLISSDVTLLKSVISGSGIIDQQEGAVIAS